MVVSWFAIDVIWAVPDTECTPGAEHYFRWWSCLIILKLIGLLSSQDPSISLIRYTRCKSVLILTIDNLWELFLLETVTRLCRSNGVYRQPLRLIEHLLAKIGSPCTSCMIFNRVRSYARGSTLVHLTSSYHQAELKNNNYALAVSQWVARQYTGPCLCRKPQFACTPPPAFYVFSLTPLADIAELRDLDQPCTPRVDLVSYIISILNKCVPRGDPSCCPNSPCQGKYNNKLLEFSDWQVFWARSSFALNIAQLPLWDQLLVTESTIIATTHCTDVGYCLFRNPLVTHIPYHVPSLLL